MKKINFPILLLPFIFLASCKNNDSQGDDFEYHAHIMTPNSTDKHLGDTIHIHVIFESHAGETVHNVNVGIYEKDSGLEVYNQPDGTQVGEVDGKYEFHDDFVLSEANGISAHKDWVLEVKVWGETSGEGEQTASVEFHVHE